MRVRVRVLLHLHLKILDADTLRLGVRLRHALEAVEQRAPRELAHDQHILGDERGVRPRHGDARERPAQVAVDLLRVRLNVRLSVRLRVRLTG